MTDPRAEQFCQIFADGLQSGLGYARIFSLLENNGLGGRTIDDLRMAVLEEGDRLGDAFERFGVLDDSARTLVAAAERQGRLPETFEQLSRIYGARYKRKKAFALGLAEPIILISLSIVLVNIVGSGLVDLAFASNLEARIWQIALTSIVQVGGFVLTAFTVLFAWLHLPVEFKIRDLFTRFWVRVPILSQGQRLFSIALFCRYLKQSVSSGLDVHTSLELAAEATNYPKLARQINRARERLKEGAGLAEALFSADALPDDVIEYIEIGEESGRLEKQLDFLTERYEELARERRELQMKIATRLLRYSIVFVVISAAFYSILSMDFSV